jgi:hypothetical protein
MLSRPRRSLVAITTPVRAIDPPPERLAIARIRERSARIEGSRMNLCLG